MRFAFSPGLETLPKGYLPQFMSIICCFPARATVAMPSRSGSIPLLHQPLAPSAAV